MRRDTQTHETSGRELGGYSVCLKSGTVVTISSRLYQRFGSYTVVHSEPELGSNRLNRYVDPLVDM